MVERPIVIVGGGIAGLCSAIALAELGLEITVLEPRSFAIDKACGEGVMPLGLRHLERLGVRAYLDKRQFSRIDGICLVNEAQQRLVSPFADGHGLGCRRVALSQALRQRVQEFRSITLIVASATAIDFSSQDSVVLHTDQGPIKSSLVIGADGLRSNCRKWAGLAKSCDPSKSKRYGIRRHYACAPWSNYVEIHFQAGIEAYITPCGPEQTNVALLWRKGEHKMALMKPNYDHMLEFFPSIASRLRQSDPASSIEAIGPLEQPCLSPISDGLALVGDASGYLDAITGEGISLAMSQAQALAPVVLKAFNQSKLSRRISTQQLIPYAKSHRAIVKDYYRNTNLLLKLASHPRLMQKLIKLGGLYPHISAKLIERLRS